jgi:membrane protein implicated in regulation of membrane protease activity
VEPNSWFWVWLGLAVVLSVAEIFTSGFFLLPFGIGAAVAALIEFFFPGSIGWQWTAFIGISSLLLVVLRRIANRITYDSPVGVGGNRLIGKQGLVTERLDQREGTGRVRVEREDWRAETLGGEVLDVGENVEVMRVEGTHLKVSAASTPASGDE